VVQILVIKMNLGAPRAGFARGVFDFSSPDLGAFLLLLIPTGPNYLPDAAAFALSACNSQIRIDPNAPTFFGARVVRILVIKMNLGAPRAGFARGVFGFSSPGLGAFYFS
jgi:hypothetical protein